MSKGKNKVDIAQPNDFDVNNHYYPRVVNASIHPLVFHFLGLGNERVIKRFCHLHPRVDPDQLRELLKYSPKWFAWAGADLFHVTTADGSRKMIVIETNSCPSGQKSMPVTRDDEEQSGYRLLIEKTFLPKIKDNPFQDGGLAVIYDKNYMEASGYAATLADCCDEPIYLVGMYDNEKDPLARFTDGILEIKVKDEWKPMRAAFRYVTQKPWARIPIKTKTLVLNPVLSCLAGGRNKLMAAKAYELFNAEIAAANLRIEIPETIRDVSKAEIPLWINKFGGFGVVKIPYSNAGQGVFTITNQRELDEFMAGEYPYEQFIVQSLVGNYNWSSSTDSGQFFHVGTVPSKRNQIFVADLRMMVHASEKGFEPLVVYARKARKPMPEELTDATDSWDILGTNLSVKEEDGSWTTETTRLCLMDRRDFNTLGLGIDDLCDAYIQTVLSAIAVDKMAQRLWDEGKFNIDLFSSMNRDDSLIKEILLE